MLVYWSSKKKNIVTLPTAKDAYVDLSTAASGNTWLQVIAGDLELYALGTMKLSGDNQTALHTD